LTPPHHSLTPRPPPPPPPPPFPTRRSSDLGTNTYYVSFDNVQVGTLIGTGFTKCVTDWKVTNPQVFVTFQSVTHLVKPVPMSVRSEEHTSELQSLAYLVCRLLLEKKKKKNI